MTVKTIKAAWEAADKIFPTDYIKDEASSLRAGYDVYRSTADNNCSYICDLGDRLEVNLDNGKTENIWITREQKLVYFIAKTYISCLGKADVSALGVAANGWESIWVSNLLDPCIQYFDTEQEAKRVAYMWANTDMTVHGRYIYID